MAVKIMTSGTFFVLALSIGVCGPASSQENQDSTDAFRAGEPYSVGGPPNPYEQYLDPYGDRSALDPNAVDAPNTDVGGDFGRWTKPDLNGGGGRRSGANPYDRGSARKSDRPRGDPYADSAAKNPYSIDAPNPYDLSGEDGKRSGANPYDPDSLLNPDGRGGGDLYADPAAKNPYAVDALNPDDLSGGYDKRSGVNPYDLESLMNPDKRRINQLGGPPARSSPAIDPSVKNSPAIEALKPYGLNAGYDKGPGVNPSDPNSLLNSGGRGGDTYGDPSAIDALNPLSASRSEKGHSRAKPSDPLSAPDSSGVGLHY